MSSSCARRAALDASWLDDSGDSHDSGDSNDSRDSNDSGDSNDSRDSDDSSNADTGRDSEPDFGDMPLPPEDFYTTQDELFNSTQA
jgi:hypothetical protein